MFGRGKKKVIVPVVTLDGVIAASKKPGKLNTDTAFDPLTKAFRVAGEGGVVLKINSPGGSPLQSELIADKIRREADKAKANVTAFVGEIAASGGYWLACAADKIVCQGKSSLVGSIGVIGAGFNFSEAMEKLGVKRWVVSQGENKSRLDPFSPPSSKDEEWLRDLQAQTFQHFKDWVVERRDCKIDIDRVATGDVWLAPEAKNLCLVDDIQTLGGYLSARFGENGYCTIDFAPKKKGFVASLFGAHSSKGIVQDTIEDAISAVQERQMWARYGL